ncbi:heavy-metal-associated domain-containing protein [Pelomicrobium sp.]|jgi:copper chaperone|uniref:heavy-metal-associated domain-containing protein n=1 Tax=Pelomicrobium sp. TaxID=2815319 RepID=UPI002FDE2092
MQTVTLKVKGMTCQGCVKSVKSALEQIEGVGRVDVFLEKGEARIEYDPMRTNDETLRAAIEGAGYEVAAA